MRWAVLLISLAGCAVDERDVSVSMPPEEQSAETCTPGTPGSICAGGLRRLCSGEGRWLMVACDSGGTSAGGAGGAPGAGTVSPGGAGGLPGASTPPMGGAGGSLMVMSGAAGASMLPSSAAGGMAGSNAGGAAGAGGAAAPSAPPEVAASCEFVYLGDWVRCENAGSPNVEQTEAADLDACMELCLERDDCTGVTDYFWLGRPDLGCWLYRSTCNSPSSPSWAMEDGGRDYRLVCD